MNPAAVSQREEAQRILDRLPVVVFEYTVKPGGERDFSYINPRCEEILGYTQAELMSGVSPMSSFIHESDRASFESMMEDVLLRKTEIRWEGRVLARNKTVWVEAIGVPRLDPDGCYVWNGVITDITTRKALEKARYEMEQRLELGLRSADLGLWDYDFRTNTTIINERWAQLMGYDRHELELMFCHCEDFIHPDDRPAYERKIQEHLQGNTDAYEVVYRFQRKDKSWRWILEKGQAVERDEHGNALRTVGVLQDFHARKLEEDSINKSEERYRTLIEFLPIGIGIHCEGKLVFVNSSACRIMGAETPQQLLGRSVLEFVAPEYQKSVLTRIGRMIKGERVPRLEEKFVRLDGQLIDVEVYGYPYEFEGKSAVQIIVRDITGQKMAEEAVLKNEVLFTQLFENSPLAVVMLDNRGKVVKINKGFETLFGFGQSELRGKGLNEFIVPDNLEREGNELNQLISGKQIIRLETKRLRKDGQDLSVILLGVPVSLADETIGIFGVYVDITEQKKLEEELKIRNTELDNFVYKVSHDLRAPLSSILGLVNLAKLPGNEDNPVEYLNLVGDRVKKLDGFINDVLSHSKNLKMEIRLAAVDLKAIIDKHFQDLSYMPQAGRVTYAIDLEGNAFYSDPWRISEVFRNLISNAIKYLDPYKSQPHVDIRVRITSEQAVIQFRDNGVGIEDKDQARVFEMFYRASDRSAGSGLGLYIVKNAVEKLGGEIKIKSIFGEGTTFTITLPNHPQP
jgi:PAS domain S-box-containing protein